MSTTTRRLAVVLAALAGAVAVAAAVQAGSGGAAEPQAVGADLRDAQGAVVGWVRLLPRPGGRVVVRAEAAGLPAGFHGFHVHAVGRCEPPFTSAGGHLDTSGSGHGGHSGDLPVLLVDADGRAHAEAETGRLALADVLDGDGSAVIVHAGPDNYANVPARYAPAGPDAATLATGDAGGRIACAVLTRP